MPKATTQGLRAVSDNHKRYYYGSCPANGFQADSPYTRYRHARPTCAGSGNQGHRRAVSALPSMVYVISPANRRVAGKITGASPEGDRLRRRFPPASSKMAEWAHETRLRAPQFRVWLGTQLATGSETRLPKHGLEAAQS